MHEPDFLLFASDATWLALTGAVLLAVSIVAMLGERRRKRRKQIDAVGWMPWTTLSVLTCFAGAVCVIMAAVGWLKS